MLPFGLGPTRALSKVANALAKASEKVWGGVVDLHDSELRKRLFAAWPVEEVWGIGPALAARLRPLGVSTAAELAALHPDVARSVGTVVLERLVLELNGIECEGFQPEPEPLKATAVTRCFGEPVSDATTIREAMVRRAVRAAEKIRAQDLVATRLIAFMHGSRFKPNAPSASRSARLSPATNDPRVVARVAGALSDAMFASGSVYTKCGVMLEGLHAADAMQGDLFAAADPKAGELLAALNGLNRRYGRSTVRLAAEGQGARSYDTKRLMKSQAWTTRIGEVPVAR
ncbi:DNA polymerase V [Sphingobium sp. B1D7B]|nr:DNA polymerase V [Sphingobium sp. B1D7B]